MDFFPQLVHVGIIFHKKANGIAIEPQPGEVIKSSRDQSF